MHGTVRSVHGDEIRSHSVLKFPAFMKATDLTMLFVVLTVLKYLLPEICSTRYL
jgi:hypothetical protein